MGAFVDLSEILHRVTGGLGGNPEHLLFHKEARIAGAAAPAVIIGSLASLWLYQGSPAHGDIPGAVSAPSNTTPGSLRFTPPTGAQQKWLLGLAATARGSGTLVMYDRLLHNGGLSGTVLTPQNVGGSLTRNLGGIGNEIWVEIYTLVGTSGTTITAAYVNELDVVRTTPAIPFGGTGNREATRLIHLPRASGDRGVKSVISVTLLASTGTAGSFGVTVARPLTLVPLSVSAVGVVRDFISGLPSVLEIPANACLSLAHFPASTSAPAVLGSLHMIEK